MQDIAADSPDIDSIYKHDGEEQNKILLAKPWANEYGLFLSPVDASPHYFKKICISAVALIKMVRKLVGCMLMVGHTCAIWGEHRGYGVDAGQSGG